MDMVANTVAPSGAAVRAVATFWLLILTIAPRPQAQDDAPVIQDLEPIFVCQGCMMQVVGSRLVGDDTEGTRLRLVREQQTVMAGVRSFSRMLEDGKPSATRETLTFGVPSDVMTGSWQLIVERDGRPSVPVTFEVLDWVPPTLHTLSPAEVGPGQSLRLTGGSLPPQVFVDLLDQNGGRLWRVETTTATPREIVFTVPNRTPEGDMLMRIGTRKDGEEWYSQLLPLKVIAIPIPSIDAGMMAPVAPGQWTKLVLDLDSERVVAQRVDVEFRQGQEVAVSGHNWDRITRIRIPPTLEPGRVTLRARLWQADRPSAWSQAVEFDVLPVPADALIQAIGVVRDGNPFTLWSARDASPPVEVQSGDRLLVVGDFPFVSPRITITAQAAPNEPVTLPIIEDRGNSVEVEVPQLAPGEWTLRVRSDDAVGPGDMGVVIRVEQ
jgi:hypothetical protein